MSDPILKPTLKRDTAGADEDRDFPNHYGRDVDHDFGVAPS
ncbi:MAG TPA: hypothetical protein VI756_20315 [Blastocatellia bacterium]